MSKRSNAAWEGQQRLIDDYAKDISKFFRKNKRLEAENDCMENALHQLRQWSKAYPIDIFPEPDFKKAHKVLTDNGISLAAISAANMRHVITGVIKIIDAAIPQIPEGE